MEEGEEMADTSAIEVIEEKITHLLVRLGDYEHTRCATRDMAIIESMRRDLSLIRAAVHNVLRNEKVS